MPIRKMNIRDIAPFDYCFGGSIGGQMTDVGRNIGSDSIGLNIQTVPPGNFSSRRHRHLFQEEILIVMSGTGLLHHGQQEVPVGPGDAVCYLAGDPEAHAFENTGHSSSGHSAIDSGTRSASILIKVSLSSKGSGRKFHLRTRSTASGLKSVAAGKAMLGCK